MKSLFYLLPILTLVACAQKTRQASYQGLGKDSVSAETLQKFAPPALEPRIKEKITRMLDIQTPGMGMLDPTNSKLFFTWKVTGTNQVWKINKPQSFPMQQTTGTDSVGIITITPDGKYLLLGIDKDGQENPGIYRQSTAGGEIETLFQKEKVQASAQYLTNDGKYLFFTANDVKPDQYTIYRMELATKKIETVFNEPGLWGIGDVDWNRQVFLLEKATGSLSSEWYLYDLKSKALTPILGQGEAVEYSLSLSQTKDQYFVTTNKFGDFRRLYVYKHGSKEQKPGLAQGFTPLSPEMNMDVEGAQVNRRHTRLLYTVNDNGYTRLYGMNAVTLKPIALPKFPAAEHMYPGATSWDDEYTMIGVSTAQAPRQAYSLNWKTGKLTQWTTPSAPLVRLDQFVSAKLEYYTARDGTKIPMLVRRSPFCTSKPCPVIVHFHGGPEGQSTPGFSPYTQLFVEAGFTFVEPNVRGSDGYGKKWISSDDGPKRLNVITDIEDAAIFIRKNWSENGVAPKIGVMGGSYGGYSTLMAMTYFAGAYDAGAAEVGMSNLLTFLNNTAPYRRMLRITEYGDPVKDHDALVKLSPMTYLDRIKAPLMIVQGANDPRVPVGEALQIKAELDSKKIPADLIIFPDEGHGSQKKSNQIIDIAATISFFRKHLKLAP